MPDHGLIKAVLYSIVLLLLFNFFTVGRSSQGRLKLCIYLVRVVCGRQRVVQQNGIETLP